MSDLRFAASRAKLLDNLYAAAETLLQAVADPIILDEAPLNHRVQALDAIGRFIDHIEKREAAHQAQQPKPEKVWDPDEPLYILEFGAPTQEEIDCYAALEIERPGSFSDVEGVVERIEYIEQNHPEALERLDPHAARQWLKYRRPGEFIRHVWPDGIVFTPRTNDARPLNRDHICSQIAPFA